MSKGTIQSHKDEALRKALDNLARYKFHNFGYWAGIWVHFNQVDGREPNPFRPLVELARRMAGGDPGSSGQEPCHSIQEMFGGNLP